MFKQAQFMSGMSRIRKIGLSTLLLLWFLVVLVAPAVVFAEVGEPIPGAEIFLAQEPGDDPIVGYPPGDDDTANTESGGMYTLGLESSIGSLEIPAGALLPSVNVRISVFQYGTPQIAKNGHKLRITAKLEPNGAGPFTVPLTLALTAPSGARNPQAYYYDGGQQEWVQMASSVTPSRNGDKVMTDISHFSWYGIGWDDNTTAAVPASSPWSLGLLVLIGAVLAAWMPLRARRSSRDVA